MLSGPSGVGKSTVVAQALALDPRIWLSVSATTRDPRPGEQDGREYFNRYAWAVTVKDGLVFSIREYMDSYYVSKLFGTG